MRDNTLKLLLLAASMTMLMPAAADAAGLGRLTVLSTLGQPLHAEVELLSVQKNETITARLASQEVYAQANAQYNNALTGTRVTVEKRPNGQVFLRATTPRVVSEPFLELLIEINSENGRVLRQYTALLDPPGYGRAASELPPPLPPAVTSAPQSRATPAPAASAAPSGTSSSASSTGSYDPAAATPAPAAAPAPAAVAAAPAARAPRPPPRASARSVSSEAPAAAEGARQYGPVKPGETLGRIARTVKPEGVTLEQTLVALHRQNPDAFIKKNMNLVRSGKILSVPEANEIASLSQRQAVQEVRLQVADWNAYRGRVADRVASAPQEGSVTSGRIGSRVADASAREGPRDTVRLSRGEGKGKGKAGSGDRVRALEEEAIAREKQLAEANSRIGQLEQIIKDSQRAVELKTAPVPAPKGAEKAGDKVAEKAAGKAGEKGAAAPSVAAPIPAPPAKAPADKGTPAEIAAAPAGKAEPAKAPETAPAQKSDPQSVAKAKKAPPPAPAPEFDIVGTLMDEPLYLAAGGAAIGLGVLGLVMARRRRTSGARGSDNAVVKIAPSLSPASPGAAGSAPGGTSGGRTSAGVSAASPSAGVAAARTPTTSRPPAPPVEPARSSPSLKPAPVTAAAPAAAKPRGSEADDNDLDFNVGMRRGGAAGAAAAPPQDMTPRAPSGEAARRVSEAPRTVTPGAPDPTPATRVPEPPKTVAPPQPSSPAPRAVEPTLRAPEPPAKAAEPPRPDHAARASEVLRAAQAQSRPPEAKPLQPLMPDFALDAAAVKPTAAAPTPAVAPTLAAPVKDPNLLDFDLDPLPALGGGLNMDKVASEPPPKVDFKLDLADLDLNAPAQRSGAPVAPKPAKDDHWYDVQQKFDLAKAYEEMGDKDGARDILQEVVREGDAEQKAEAKKLLGPLS